MNRFRAERTISMPMAGRLVLRSRFASYENLGISSGNILPMTILLNNVIRLLVMYIIQV